MHSRLSKGIAVCVLGLLASGCAAGLVMVAPTLSPPPAGSIAVGIAAFGRGPAATQAANELATEILHGAAAENIQQLAVRISPDSPTTWEQAETLRVRSGVDFLWWGELGAEGQITANLALAPGFSPREDQWQEFSDPDLGALLLPERNSIELPAAVGVNPLVPLTLGLAHFRAGQFVLAARASDGAQATITGAGGSGAFPQLLGAISRIGSGDAPSALRALDGLDAPRDTTLEALADRALARLGAGDYGSSISDADQVIATREAGDRTSAIAYYIRGRAHEATSDYSAAVSDFDSSLRLNSGNIRARLEKANALYHQSRPEAARAELAAVLGRAPYSAPAHRLVGLVSLMLGQPQQAQSSLGEAEKIYDQWIAGLRAQEGQAQVNGDVEQRQRATDSIIELDRELASVYLYQGMAYADIARQEPPETFLGGIWRRIRGQPTTYERAIARMQDAARLDPRRADIPVQMSSVYSALGDMTSATMLLNQAQTLDPSAPEPYMALAKLQEAQKDSRGAATTLAALIARLPEYYAAYEALYDLDVATGDTGGARAILNKALTLPAATGQDHFWHGKFLATLGRSGEAIAEFRDATEDPDLWEAHLNLAQLLQASGTTTEALGQFQAVLAAQPNQPDALLGAGKILVASGQPDQAEQMFKRLTSLSPNVVDGHIAYTQLLLSKGDVSGARQQAQAGVEAGNQRADAHFFLAEVYETAQDWGQAAEQFDIATKRDPTLFEAFIRLARALCKDDRYAESIKASESAREMRPDDPQPYMWKAEAELAAGDSATALADVDTGLKYAPGDADLLGLASRVYAARGIPSMAIRFANRAISADAHNPAGELALGDVYLCGGRTSEAIKAFQAIAPPNAAALVGQGRVQEALGNPTEALKLFREAATADPHYAEAHLYSGHSYVELGQWGRALSEYQSAVKIRRHWPLALYYLGRAYLQNKDLQNAERAFAGGTQYAPNMVEGWFGLGITERELGHSKAAVGALSRAVDLNPTYSDAWLYLGLSQEEAGDRAQAADAFAHARDTATAPDILEQAREGLLRVK